jgi:hypothetical protein
MRFKPGGPNRQSDSNRAVRIDNAIRAGRHESAKRFELGGPNRQIDSNRAVRIDKSIRTGRPNRHSDSTRPVRIGKAIRAGRCESAKRFESGDPNRQSDSSRATRTEQLFEPGERFLPDQKNRRDICYLHIRRCPPNHSFTINVNGRRLAHKTKTYFASCQPCSGDPRSIPPCVLIIRFVCGGSCFRFVLRFVCKAGCELWNLRNEPGNPTIKCLARGDPCADLFFCWPGRGVRAAGVSFRGWMGLWPEEGIEWANLSSWQQRGKLRTGPPRAK